MQKITNTSCTATLYFLEDNKGNIVATTTSIEALMNAFEGLIPRGNGVGYSFRKLVGNELLYVDDNELPDWFFENPEDDEYYGYDPYHPGSSAPPPFWI